MSWLSSAVKKTKKALKKAGTQAGHAVSKAAKQTGKAVKKGAKQYGNVQTALAHPVELHKGKLTLSKKTKKLAGNKLADQINRGLGIASSALSGQASGAASSLVSGGGGFGDVLGGLRGTLSDIGGYVNQAEDAYSQVSSLFGGDDSGGGNMPDSSEQQGPQTPSMMPFILIGGAALIVVVLLAKK
jgi:hypothetical protein